VSLECPSSKLLRRSKPPTNGALMHREISAAVSPSVLCSAFTAYRFVSDALRGLHFSCAMCPFRAVVRVNSAPHRGQ
jgi:hypothetical protein